MPEGDVLFRTAHALHGALVGVALCRVESPLGIVTQASLAGHRVTRVEARGKNLLVFMDDERVLYTHLGMHGAWHVCRPGERWRRPRRALKVALYNERAVAVCFDAPVVEISSARELPRHPVIGALGPDLCAETFDRDEALARLGRLARLPIGEAVMNQQAVAGIGNVFKSEVLFIAGVSPFASVAALGPETLARVVDVARTLLRRNRGRGPRVTRFAPDGPREWVYGRSGEPCLRCGELVGMRRQGLAGRSTYFCRRCQPEVRPTVPENVSRPGTQDAEPSLPRECRDANPPAKEGLR